MADQEHKPVAGTPLSRETNAAPHSEVPFPEGVSPSVNVDQVRQDILRRVTAEPPARQTLDSDVSGHTSTTPDSERPPTPELGQTLPTEKDGTIIEASTETSALAKKESLLQRGFNGAKDLLLKIGESLRRIPGVEACIAGATRAIEFIAALFTPPREVSRVERVLSKPDSVRNGEESATAKPLENTVTRDTIELEEKCLVDPLEGSKKFHAAIVKAAHELGESAQREHEKEEKEEQARLEHEQEQARKAAELVRAIDLLSGASNGETQAIIDKLSGPFAISLEQALRLARDAESREIEERQQLDHEAVVARISSIRLRKSTTLAA